MAIGGVPFQWPVQGRTGRLVSRVSCRARVTSKTPRGLPRAVSFGRLPGGLARIAVGPEKVQRHIRRITDYPTVVRQCRNVEEFPCPKLDDCPALERRRGGAPQHHPDVLNSTARRTDHWPHVF